jgi:hypothetical protein
MTGVEGEGGGIAEGGGGGAWRVRAASRLSTSVAVFCCATREGWEDVCTRSRRGRTIERETGLDLKAKSIVDAVLHVGHVPVDGVLVRRRKRL